MAGFVTNLTSSKKEEQVVPVSPMIDFKSELKLRGMKVPNIALEKVTSNVEPAQQAKPVDQPKP